jgi:hypothetical protein
MRDQKQAIRDQEQSFRDQEQSYPDLSVELFQVRSQGMNQVVRSLGLVIGGCDVRIQNMKPDVSLNHLSHESVHGAPASRNIMQHVGTLGLLVQRPFNSFHLTPDSSYPIE